MSDKNEVMEKPMVVPAEKARAGRQGKQTLYVLIGAVIGAVVAVFATLGVVG